MLIWTENDLQCYFFYSEMPPVILLYFHAELHFFCFFLMPRKPCYASLFLSGGLKYTIRVFPRRLTNGEMFNNSLLFKNNRLLFSLLFSGDGGGQSCDGGSPLSPHQGKPWPSSPDLQSRTSYTMYGLSWTSLGLPWKFFHYNFDCFDVHLNSTESW